MINPGGETGVTSDHAGSREEGPGKAEMKAMEMKRDGLCQGNGDGRCAEDSEVEFGDALDSGMSFQ